MIYLISRDFYLFAFVIMCLFLGKFFQNTIISSFLPLFSLLYSFLPLFFCHYTRVLGERDFTSRYKCGLGVRMDIRRKSYDVFLATGPSWFSPLATMLKGRAETAKRQGEGMTGRDAEWWSEVETRFSFFVLARNLSVSLAITLICSQLGRYCGVHLRLWCIYIRASD